MPSLKARAVAYLARRDHGRAELREKLLRPPRVAPRSGPLRHDPPGGAVTDGASEPSVDVAVPTPEAVDAVLDSLEAGGWLDDGRAAAGRAAAKAARHGLRRIEADLSRRGLSLDAATAADLRATELDRAREVWRRRFGQPPADARDRARQWRFLVGRGFDASVVGRILGGEAPDGADDASG